MVLMNITTRKQNLRVSNQNLFLKKKKYHAIKPGMVVQGYHASIQETETEDSRIQVHPVIYNEALSINKPTTVSTTLTQLTQ